MKSTILSWENQVDRGTFALSLTNEKICIGSSDTVLGLYATPTLATFNDLNTIKGRSDKPYVVLFQYDNFFQKMKSFFFITEKLSPLIRSCWPGPVTLILKATNSLPHYMQSNKQTAAVRIPNHEGLQTLLGITGPLFSTSANLAGESVPETLQEVNPTILQKVEYGILSNVHSASSQPSTILDCSEETIKVVRKGAYCLDLLQASYKEPFLYST